MQHGMLIWHIRVKLPTLTAAINELLCLKNAGAQVSLFFNSYEQSASKAIEKIKILGAVLELHTS
jgi:pyridoxine 5'-phosphate synthase PdxJ